MDTHCTGAEAFNKALQGRKKEEMLHTIEQQKSLYALVIRFDIQAVPFFHMRFFQHLNLVLCLTS